MILILISLRGVNQTNIDNMKYSEIERKLKKAGCYWKKDGKKHPIWYSPNNRKGISNKPPQKRRSQVCHTTTD